MLDKEIEKNRYNNEANKALEGNKFFSVNKLTQPLKMPYIFYQKLISDYSHKGSFVLEIGAGMGDKNTFIFQYSINFIKHFIVIPITQTTRTHYNVDYSHKGSFVLEIGAGMGENTKFLLATEAKVCATDISEYSLSVIEKRFNNDKLTTKVADMEKLPFAGQSFDIIVSAGSLSYGDNDKVLDEIYRVLKNKGVFIAIDSLNNNPIYRLNRCLHYYFHPSPHQFLKQNCLYGYNRRLIFDKKYKAFLRVELTY
jgi:ubiquinone/menaquinone biosynthesis C-methylase UbiE